MTGLTAVLLTGGRSRRFGTDKAFHQVAGRPLWQVQLEKLQQAGADRYLISGNEEQQFPQLPEGVDLIRDKWPDRGPLGGLATALSAVRKGHILVLAVDLVSMTPAWLAGLKERALPGKAVIPRNGDLWEPLAAIYPAEWLSAMETRLEGDDLSIRGFLQKRIREIEVKEIAPEDDLLFQNLNRPQ